MAQNDTDETIGGLAWRRIDALLVAVRLVESETAGHETADPRGMVTDRERASRLELGGVSPCA